jgi:hypothetical protein
VEARFSCAVCGAEAGRILLSGTASSGHVTRESFTSRLEMGVSSDQFARLTSAIPARDARALHTIDLEIASFYCPRCDACYCGDHWKRWSRFDDDGWHDSIRGLCPQGHERMLED